MASDAARIGHVRRALRTLRKGVTATRAELFKDMPEEKGNREFARKLLNKLVLRGAVRRTAPLAVGQSAVFILDDVDKLDEILESEEALSDFIWQPEMLAPANLEAALKKPEIPAVAPTQQTFDSMLVKTGVLTPKPVMPQPPHPPPATNTAPPMTKAPPTEPAAFLAPAPYIPLPPGQPLPVADKGTIEETNRLLGELIDTMHASLQSTIYTREVVDDIRKEFSALATRQRDLNEKLDELQKAWGGK